MKAEFWEHGFITGVSYPTRDALLQGLESQAIDGALIDILTVDSFKKELNNSDFEVVKVLPNTFHYGIILTGDARNLSKYFEEYLVNHPVELLLQEEEVRKWGTMDNREIKELTTGWG